MKNIFVFIASFVFWPFYAQVGIGTTTPEPSAMLDVQSTTSGFAMPRMSSTDRININNPVPGLQVYDTTYKAVWFFDGNEWRSMGALAYGRISPNGTPLRIVGATVRRIGRGHYRITFNTPMPSDDYMISLSLRQEDDESRDDVVIYWRYLTTDRFDVYIQDNDNGSNDGTPTDNMFMFSVYY
ncbi:MAG: hypothetical protein GXO24_06555 [Chlorobi bacterium]|nr:hypothetical protein [Chlorobiota bacterium]